MKHRVPDSEPKFNRRPQDKLKQRNLLLLSPGGVIWHDLRGKPGRSGQGEGKESGRV